MDMVLKKVYRCVLRGAWETIVSKCGSNMETANSKLEDGQSVQSTGSVQKVGE